MKLPRGFLILCALIILGGCIGLLLSKWQVSTVVQEQVRAEVSGRAEIVDFTDESEQESAAWNVEFPEHAISGEMVVHFTSREDYLAYLQALANAGLSPLGQIDELMVVRIAKGALSGPNPGHYGARGSFSYRVEQPLPPVEIARWRLVGGPKADFFSANGGRASLTLDRQSCG